QHNGRHSRAACGTRKLDLQKIGIMSGAEPISSLAPYLFFRLIGGYTADLNSTIHTVSPFYSKIPGMIIHIAK
ncbi:MAG: hypothetical protein ACYST5_10930, partial [Planctomycetota bacterium]